MRPSLQQLETFVAVAREGTVRAAAARLSRSQSAASMALAELESRVGRALFDRKGKRLLLNGDGQRLLPGAIALLDQADAIPDLFGEASGGPLRLAASLTIANHLLPPIVTRWRSEHPGAFVQLRVGNTRDVVEAMLRFDVAVGFVEGSVHHEDLIVSAWRRDELIICARPGDPITRRRATREALARAPWIVREPGSGTRETVDQGLMRLLGWPRPVMELGSSEAIRVAVAAGAGVTCLSRHVVADALAAGTLVEVRSVLAPPSRDLCIVTHRDRRLSSSASAFVAFCRKAKVPAPAGRSK